MRSRNPYGLYRPAGKPNTDPYKDDNRRMMRETWAAFCTERCPHPGRQCNRDTCKEFKLEFGGRRDA